MILAREVVEGHDKGPSTDNLNAHVVSAFIMV